MNDFFQIIIKIYIQDISNCNWLIIIFIFDNNKIINYYGIKQFF